MTDDDAMFALRPEPAEEPLAEDQPDCDATVRGIAGCLRMLADEAATLRLPRTLAALKAAIAACAEEGPAAEVFRSHLEHHLPDDQDVLEFGAPAGAVLH
jgi:hypothetical protein